MAANGDQVLVKVFVVNPLHDERCTIYVCIYVNALSKLGKGFNSVRRKLAHAAGTDSLNVNFFDGCVATFLELTEPVPPKAKII